MSDQKDAVNIGVTLSTQLIAASLAMIAVVATFVTFVIDKRSVDIAYYLIVGGAFLSFVISIFLGGKGIDKARKNGFLEIWNLTDTKNRFSLQAFFCLLGIVFFICSVFFSKDKNEEIKTRIETIEKKIIYLQAIDSITNARIVEMQIQIDSLQNKKSYPPKPDRYKYFRGGDKTIIQYFDSVGVVNNKVTQ